MRIENITVEGYEQVLKAVDRACGLTAFIAIHDTTLGPALGGCRMWPYASHDDALADVLRLARGMTQKNALADLPLGGGKAVIVGDPKTDKSPQLFRAFGRVVESLNGLYYTAEDVGMNVEDMGHIAEETRYVVGRAREQGGSGDPSPATAKGVFLGLRETARHRLGSDDLTGLKVIVTGLGHVGFKLCGLLHEAGADLIVADLDVAKVRLAVDTFDAREAHPMEAYAKAADILAPCALGGVLNAATIPLLQVAAVAGAANNQLSEPAMGDLLHQRGILYAPDYVINAGGVINIAGEIEGHWDPAASEARIAGIARTLNEIFQRAEQQNRATNRIADEIAEERLARARARRTGRSRDDSLTCVA